MAKYTYLKGSENSREVVEFETTAEPLYRATTCVVDVDLLICGITTFHYGSGDDVKLTLEQRKDILTLVQEERGKMIHVPGPKTMQMWHDSGLRTFEEFFLPGDTVAEDIIEYFTNIMPPQTMWSGLLQAGEPYSHEYDQQTGKHRATYSTFSKVNGEWYFAGYCFSKETKNQVTRMGRLAAALFDVEYLIEAENHKKEGK